MILNLNIFSAQRADDGAGEVINAIFQGYYVLFFNIILRNCILLS